MKLNTAEFTVTDFQILKQKVLNWLQQFDTFSFLDNHQYSHKLQAQECLAGAGIRHSTNEEETDAGALQKFVGLHAREWIFGHICYEAPLGKDQQPPTKPAGVSFTPYSFFVPAVVLAFGKQSLQIYGSDPQQVYQEIMDSPVENDTKAAPRTLVIEERTSRDEYLQIISKLLAHIQRGDCYEINFCQEFFAEAAEIDPLSVYKRLSALSPSPFSALYKRGHNWLLCASPERYLKKQGDTLISQPIKGTAKRMQHDPEKDEQGREALARSSKDRSENVMIVDLVRNDLARICLEGSVKAEELYSIYSFPQVHQMISTISGKLPSDIRFTDILQATFPMGSMTGAPKKKVMELIEKYEPVSRGLFSGTIGYIDPAGDFDFNVVIRSILYDAARQYLSMPAGSGITIYSDPQQEWEECQLKAAALKQAVHMHIE